MVLSNTCLQWDALITQAVKPIQAAMFADQQKILVILLKLVQVTDLKNVLQTTSADVLQVSPVKVY